MKIHGFNRKEGEEREPNDFYATHPSAVPPLMKILNFEKGGKLIRENSCGAGHLSIMMETYGHKVISTDLINRGYGVGGVDFLKPHELDLLPYDAVIMNPPYKVAQAFIEKSLKLAPVVCAFLRLAFLESQGRVEFFKNNPPRYVAVFVNRIRSSKNARFDLKESSPVCYAWFIWQNGYKDKPEILWI